MFDYQAVRKDLEQLHRAASPIEGYFKAQAAEFIEVGEYSLALDTIASAYLSNNLRMPTELFAIFDHLAQVMELDSDPEFDGVAKLRKVQGAAS
ncbi:MAG: hypothetical protein NVS2B1_00130 [Bradyrhizobium sp.]